MITTPKSLRLNIALFGRTNVGKSSFLNMIVNQDVSITSHIPGTTTDVVEKSMELLPIGPVNFLDTGGIDDSSQLAEKRIERSLRIIDRADVICIIVEPNNWADVEERIFRIAEKKNLPVIVVVNKTDLQSPTDDFYKLLKSKNLKFTFCSTIQIESADRYRENFKQVLMEMLPEDFFNPHKLISDLVEKNDIVILIIPIDKEAPKGRIILPQVQTIRDLLDIGAIPVMCRDTEYKQVLASLHKNPTLVVCDSQVVDKMVRDTPVGIRCTTFSILFSRYKGNLAEEVRGVAALKKLKNDEKVLIAEACSHHPNQDDIGREKIPIWLKNYIGNEVLIDVVSGRDYPRDLNQYKLIIHCGGCMLTRNEKLARIDKARSAQVPITNYGIMISAAFGVLERVLEPFPDEHSILLNK